MHDWRYRRHAFMHERFLTALPTNMQAKAPCRLGRHGMMKHFLKEKSASNGYIAAMAATHCEFHLSCVSHLCHDTSLSHKTLIASVVQMPCLRYDAVLPRRVSVRPWVDIDGRSVSAQGCFMMDQQAKSLHRLAQNRT